MVGFYPQKIQNISQKIAEIYHKKFKIILKTFVKNDMILLRQANKLAITQKDSHIFNARRILYDYC